jgi:hypothetical protein
MGLFSSNTKKKQESVEVTERTINLPSEVYELLLLFAQNQKKSVEEIVEENPLLLAQLYLSFKKQNCAQST